MKRWRMEDRRPKSEVRRRVPQSAASRVPQSAANRLPQPATGPCLKDNPILPLVTMQESALMISVSGIRGRVGFGLTPEVVARYAAAFGAWALAPGKSRAVVLGRDSRVSG